MTLCGMVIKGAGDIAELEHRLQNLRKIMDFRTHGNNDGVDSAIFEKGVVNHGRLEGIRRIAQMGDEAGCAGDHGPFR